MGVRRGGEARQQVDTTASITPARVFEEKQKKWESDEGERHVNK